MLKEEKETVLMSEDDIDVSTAGGQRIQGVPSDPRHTHTQKISRDVLLLISEAFSRRGRLDLLCSYQESR